MNPLALTMLFASLAVCASACTSRDVTRQAKYHVGYVPDRVYVLKTDQELIHGKDWKDEEVHALASPGTVAGPAGEWLDLLVTLPAGTRIRIDQLRYETSINLSDVERSVDAYGCILDPPHDGQRVFMGGVSDYEPFPAAVLRSMVMKPTPALIQLAVE